MSGPSVTVVTGAGGYIGTELTKQLLICGYTVRATVRKIGAPQYAHLEKLSSVLPGKLELYEADMNDPNCFEKAFDGAKYIFHTASPVEFGSGSKEKDQEDIVNPAVSGAVGAVKTAAKSKSVKRVVMTSSIAAVTPKHIPTKSDGVYTDESWNDYDTVETAPYFKSKTIAEEEARKSAEDLGVDLVTIHPSMVIGPLSCTRSGLSADLAKNILEGDEYDQLGEYRHIDVRDVAEAHIRAAEIPTAKGRYILSHSHTTNHKEITDALQAAFPEYDIKSAKETTPEETFDISKTEKELGMKLIPATRSWVDAARTNIAFGRVSKK